MKCNGCGTPLGDFKLFSVVTDVNFSGHTTADDSCSRWRQDEANEV